jgi:hypothetical protein
MSQIEKYFCRMDVFGATQFILFNDNLLTLQVLSSAPTSYSCSYGSLLLLSRLLGPRFVRGRLVLVIVTSSLTYQHRDRLWAKVATDFGNNDRVRVIIERVFTKN